MVRYKRNDEICCSEPNPNIKFPYLPRLPTEGTQKIIHHHPYQPIFSRPIKPKKTPSIFTITIAMQKVFLFMHRHGIAIEIERNKQNVGVEENICRTQAGE